MGRSRSALDKAFGRTQSGDDSRGVFEEQYPRAGWRTIYMVVDGERVAECSVRADLYDDRIYNGMLARLAQLAPEIAEPTIRLL